MRNDARNDVTPPRPTDLPILDGEIIPDDSCANCDGCGTVALDHTDDGMDCPACGGTGKVGAK